LNNHGDIRLKFTHADAPRYIWFNPLYSKY